VTWRTGFPIDIGARLPNNSDPFNPGTSGAGDPLLSRAAVVSPIRYLDPRKKTTINVINYASTAGQTTCTPFTTTPVTGNFYFDPNSFTNVGFENTDPTPGVFNPCFPLFDPVNNPSQRTYGLSRNFLRGPDLVNVDIALAKATAITERVNLEFRLEFFNALNHAQFSQPTVLNNAANINSSLFGQITTTGTFRGATPRIGQLAARLTF
jgi:hypothetical protein